MSTIWLLGLLGVAVAMALAVWLGSSAPEGGGKPPTHTSHARDRSGYSIYCFEKGSWSLQEDRSAPGFVAGGPPAEAGQFEGDCVKVQSVPKAEAR
jgi:hypothetical protein